MVCRKMAALLRAPSKLQLFVFFIVFVNLFVSVSSSIIQYDRQTLLDIRSSLKGNFVNNFLMNSNGSNSFAEASTSLFTSATELEKKRKRGKRARILCRTQKITFKSTLQSIHLANVQSLVSKMDKLNAQIFFSGRHQKLLCSCLHWDMARRYCSGLRCFASVSPSIARIEQQTLVSAKVAVCALWCIMLYGEQMFQLLLSTAVQMPISLQLKYVHSFFHSNLVQSL